MNGELATDGSRRTYERATALTFLRGCVEENPCWSDCFEAAKATITEARMTDWERGNLGTVMAELYGPPNFPLAPNTEGEPMNMEDKVCESWISLDDGTELHCDRHPGHVTAHRSDTVNRDGTIWRWKNDAQAAWSSPSPAPLQQGEQ